MVVTAARMLKRCCTHGARVPAARGVLIDHRVSCYTSGSRDDTKAQVAPCTMDRAAFVVLSPATGWSAAVPIGSDRGAFASSGLSAVAGTLR